MEDQARLRIATMNVLGPAHADWSRRRPVLARALTELSPDIVALQEIAIGSGRAVAELLGPGYNVRGFAHTAGDGVGAALATRWPMTVLAELDQRCTRRSLDFLWCATLLVSVETPLGPILVAHHKPSWQFGFEYEREQQAVAAVRLIERHTEPGTHVVVLGDFDATSDAASMQFWRGRRSLDGISACYQDAWETVHPHDPGFTFSAENPLVRRGEVGTALSRRIDYILVRSGLHGPTLRIDSCARVLDSDVDGVWGSDHFGVTAELARPDHSPGSWA